MKNFEDYKKVQSYHDFSVWERKGELVAVANDRCSRNLVRTAFKLTKSNDWGYDYMRPCIFTRQIAQNWGFKV